MHARSWLPPLLVTIALASQACGSRTGPLEDEVLSGASRDGGLAGDGGLKPLACTPGQFKLSRASGQLVFTIDRSGSMRLTLDGQQATPSRPSRWTVLGDALTPVLASLEANIEVGAKFFPARIDNPSAVDPITACVVDSAVDVLPAKGGSEKILDVFRSTSPGGGTPTSDALRAAATYLSAPERRSIARYIVLATDGGPNCNAGIGNPGTCVCTTTDPTACRTSRDGQYSCLDDVRTIATVRDIAGKQKIPTYVLGLGDPGRPEFVDTLDAMAVAGERPRAEKPFYYDIRTPDQLGSALASIQKSISRCSFVTPSRPDHPDAIAITVDGKAVVRDRAQGWEWIDRDFGQIEFFGDICAALATSGEAPNVSATVTCNTN